MTKVTDKRTNEWKAFKTLDEAEMFIKIAVKTYNRFKSSSDKRYTKNDFMIEFI